MIECNLDYELRRWDAMSKYQREAKMFQALAHPVRLQILEALARRPLCVCELVALTGRRQANISQHLALLREVELVSCMRTGWNVYYRMNANRLASAIRALYPIIPLDVADSVIKPIRENAQMGNEDLGKWHGIPRVEILWLPTVVAERCVGCGLCATSCGRGVYAFDYEQNRPVVEAPEKCMVGCTICATLCIQDAIEFPSAGYIRQVIRQKKILRQSKDMLYDNREKYDTKARGSGMESI